MHVLHDSSAMFNKADAHAAPVKSAAASERVADGVLLQLWQRRACLTQDEMASIYTIVHRALKTYFPFELQGLAEDKEELISQFIYFKVFRLENPKASTESFPAHSAPTNGYAVCAYFRRYLIDCLRSASHQRNLSFDSPVATIEMEQQCAAQSDPIHAVLVQYGLDETTVRESATRFISELGMTDRLLLAGSLGSLSNARGGLSWVAERYGIASYHYRARKLGITLKKGSIPADFAATSIGQWIERTLGIDIAVENRVAILLALGILAEQSGIQSDPSGDVFCECPEQG